MSLEICVSQVEEHTSLGICFSQVEEHISLGICFFLGRGTHIITYMCFPAARIQRFYTYLDGMFGITAGCDFPSNAIQFMPCLKAILLQQKQLT